MRKSIYIIFFLLLSALNSNAVLKEKDLSGTLTILRHELTTAYRDNSRNAEIFRMRNNAVQSKMLNIMQKSNMNALMLYSQKKEYVFDLAYACHEATEQYKNFQQQAQPFKKFADKIAFEEARYDSLIASLRNMPTIMLDEQGQEDRSVCLALAVNLQRQLQERNDQIKQYIERYNTTDGHLKLLNDYANVRYAEIQQNIFKNGGDNFYTIITSLASQMSDAGSAVNDKYKTYGNVRSEWDVKVILFLFGAIIFYGLVAILLNVFIIRFVVPHFVKNKGFYDRQGSINMATTFITFAITIGIVKHVYDQNFVAMAGDLLVQYSWLVSVVIISVLLRLNPTQLSNAYKMYSPLIAISFIVIVFRIVLIPNALVNLIFPPVILGCALWQWYVIRRNKAGVPKSDVFYAQVSQAIFLFSIGCSWMGFTLLAVQALIWWTMQLTCILTISCVRDWLNTHEEKRNIKNLPITKAWGFYFVQNVMAPIMGIASILISIFWAADVFNLSDTMKRFFDYKFINEENFTLSMTAMVLISSLWFIFRYLCKLIIDFAHHHFTATDPSTADSRIVMIKNVVQIIVWGAWFLLSLAIMKVSNQWLVVISGGLSTGVGFASKDIIENIYYGISLMAGRIKIGDWIECDGTRGKVISISYTSTMVEAIDGSVIAFQNSQLFTKNYKNLTRNHGYVLSIVEFGVAYGSKVNEVKAMVEKGVKGLRHPAISKKRPINIVLSDLADSSVNFKLCTWVDVTKQAIVESELRQLVYDTLNNNNIEIPFPQTDVHIKN